MEVIWLKPPTQEGPPGTRCPGLCPDTFWIFPKMNTSEFLEVAHPFPFVSVTEGAGCAQHAQCVTKNSQADSRALVRACICPIPQSIILQWCTTTKVTALPLPQPLKRKLSSADSAPWTSSEPNRRNISMGDKEGLKLYGQGRDEEWTGLMWFVFEYDLTATNDMRRIEKKLWKNMQYSLFPLLVKSWFVSQSTKCLCHLSKKNIKISLLNFKNCQLYLQSTVEHSINTYW